MVASPAAIMTRRWRSFAWKPRGPGGGTRSPVAIDDHDVLGTDLVAHGLILAPASPCGSRVTATHGSCAASSLACGPRGGLRRRTARRPPSPIRSCRRPARRTRGAARAAARSAGRAPRPRRRGRSRQGCQLGRARHGERRGRAAPRRARALRRPAGSARRPRPCSAATPGHASTTQAGAPQRARLEQLAAAARERGVAARGEERDVGADLAPRARAARPASSGSGSVAFASRSAAPASALPPPSPAPTGARFSMLHPPARRRGRCAPPAAAARASRAQSPPGEPRRLDVRRRRRARARATSPSGSAASTVASSW